MSVKFDNFVVALKALCVEHEVFLSTSGYDVLSVFNMDVHDPEGIDSDRIEDCTDD